MERTHIIFGVANKPAHKETSMCLMILYRDEAGEMQRDIKNMDHNWSGQNRTKKARQGHKGERLKQSGKRKDGTEEHIKAKDRTEKEGSRWEGRE